MPKKEEGQKLEEVINIRLSSKQKYRNTKKEAKVDLGAYKMVIMVRIDIKMEEENWSTCWPRSLGCLQGSLQNIKQSRHGKILVAQELYSK